MTAASEFPRGLRRIRNNWCQSWSLGRFEFEVEWVPKGRCYKFMFSINTPEKDLARYES